MQRSTSDLVVAINFALSDSVKGQSWSAYLFNVKKEIKYIIMSDQSCLVVKFYFKCRCEVPIMFGKCTNEGAV